MCTMLIDFEFEGPSGQLNIFMLGLSLVYALYGTFISVYLYGRKTDHLKEYWQTREELK